MRHTTSVFALLLTAAAAESENCTAIGVNVQETGAYVACCDDLVLIDASPPNSEVPVYVCAGLPPVDATPTPTPTPVPSPSPTPPTGGRCAVYHSTASPPPPCLICDKSQKRKVLALSLRWVSRASTPVGASLAVDLAGAALSPAGEVPQHVCCSAHQLG